MAARPVFAAWILLVVLGVLSAFASPSLAQFTITASAGANGSISPNGAIVVNHGANQSFTFTPTVGHHVTDVLVDGASVGVVTSYSFTNVTADHTIAVSFAFSTHHSSAIAVSPDGREAWVVNPDHGSVSVLGLQAPDENQLLAEIPVGAEPWSVDIHPTNGEVWVTSMAEDKVFIIDAASRTVVGSIATGFETFAVAFNPAGTTALVTASGADKVHAINVATRTVTNTMFVYRRPRGIAWKSDGSRAWVSHLLMPELTGRLTAVNPSFWTTSSITLNQVFALANGGYPSTMQNLSLFPAPGDTVLWIPNNMINTAAGEIAHNPLTPFKIFHATIRPVNIAVAQGDRPGSTYYLSNGAPVGGPIAVDFKDGKAYVANLHSDNVTVLTAADPLAPTHLALIAAGKGPIGIVTHPTLPRAYVANWLSRSVTVIDTDADLALTTIPSVTEEVLSPALLNGKQLFYTSTGALSMDGRGSCASCHVFDRSDSRPWDLSQFGKHLRATPDMRGIGRTGAHDWTADKDEMQDHNFGILEFTGGAGLIPSPNPPLGAPNAGLSQDMDDMALYMTSVEPRRGSPFRNPDGSHTANALVGQAIFNDPAVGCASCHVPPFYTDSKLTENPFIRHIVGTADPDDADGAAGYDTPSLINLWDSGPYLHDHLASSAGATAAPALMKVLTVMNPDDQHGVTSTLTSPQRSALVSFLLEITWPDSSVTTGVEPPTADGRFGNRVDAVFPNPFRDETSLRFSIEHSPSKVQIDLFDVAGRHVRTLLDREMARGAHIVGWDSRDAAGREVAAGSYFARLIVNGEAQASKRMAVLR